MSERQLTGGCQCGAMRYAIPAPTKGVHLCHCRMCQKAVGNYFAALAPSPRDQITWTRGAPQVFRSSTAAARGFCAACGTPLTFEYVGRSSVHVTVGSLDDPSAVVPDMNFGVESRVATLAKMAEWRDEKTDAARINELFPGYRGFQHPDHYTEQWPEATP